MAYHTDLSVILKPLEDIIDNYNWVISDLEYIPGVKGLPLNFDDDYFVFSSEQFKDILLKDIQFVWAIVLAVPKNEKIELIESNLPYAEFNPLVWKNGNIQYQSAEIEIICWDSSCTIVKLTKEKLSDKFKDYFGEDAMPLENFNYNKLYK